MKKYFTYFNRNEAEAYIGKKCKFSNFEGPLAQGCGIIGRLSEVVNREHYDYVFQMNGNTCYRFCTPVETKIRPYKDFEELVKGAEEHGKTGNEARVFKIKRKGMEIPYQVALLRDCVVRFFCSSVYDEIIIFAELAEEYEWIDGTPCGVEEDI